MADEEFGQDGAASQTAGAEQNPPKRTRGPAKKTRAKKEPEGAIEQAAAAVTGAAVMAARTSRRTAASARRTVAAAPRAGVKRAGEAVKSRTAANLGLAAAGVAAGLAIGLGRKALVQAPSTLWGDWFDAVKTEHKMALTLFDALAKTTESDRAKRSTLLTQLKRALSKHAFMEENVLYPALRVKGDKADADKLNHDHGYVKQYLYDLENMDNASPEFLLKVAEFRREIEEHIDEEEQTIFPPLHAAMGADGNAKLTAQANKEAFKLA
jgi:hemerythrin superfamily protein